MKEFQDKIKQHMRSSSQTNFEDPSFKKQKNDQYVDNQWGSGYQQHQNFNPYSYQMQYQNELSVLPKDEEIDGKFSYFLTFRNL